MWSKIILDPTKDNLENGFLKPEYPFKLSLDNFLPSSRCRLAESNGRPIEYHPRLINCRDFKLIDWKQEELIIFIISTSGNGKETK